MKSIAVTRFKAQCLSLLEDVARTGQPLVVTKHGKPLARVVPTSAVGAAHPQDSLFGTIETVGDIVEPVVPRTRWNALRGVLLTGDRRRKRSR